MNRLSSNTLAQLRNISLVRVMEHHGHKISGKDDKGIFFSCPFHADKSPSFRIIGTGSFCRAQGYRCFSCDRKGSGAIELEAAILGKDPNDPDSFMEACLSLARTYNIPLTYENGDTANPGWKSRVAVADKASDEIEYYYKDWTDKDLVALGCIVTPVFDQDGTVAHDSKGDVLKKYSWNESFYEKNILSDEFDASLLERLFNLRPVESFVSQAMSNKEKGGKFSNIVTATEEYPIFEFRYEDNNGWWSKKYEPYYHAAPGAKNYKFTWWCQGGIARKDLNSKLYGDADFMRAFNGEGVSATEESHPVIPVKTRVGGEEMLVKKFKRLIICSGPRDGINTYFHSDAHVCWPHSESSIITPSMMAKISKIADEVFVMYDADETGKKNAEKLALQFLSVKMIKLPSDLSRARSPRTGNPCKDAEEFFNYYPQVLEQKGVHESINDIFEGILKTALTMKFWSETFHKTNTGGGEREPIIKYKLRTDNMTQFLESQGMMKEEVAKNQYRYVIVRDHRVEVIPDGEALKVAKTLMKDFLKSGKAQYYTQDLSDTISNATRLNAATLTELADAHLNFKGWKEDEDYFTFGNTPLKITAEERKVVPYSSLPFHVNVESIIDWDYYPTNEKLFDIIEHPLMEGFRKDHEERMREAETESARETERMRFAEIEKLWSFKLILYKPMEEMPPFFQYLYDTGRVYWKIEAAGLQLTDEQKQFQDMQFINKAGAIGYLLSRHRDGTRAQMVTITDYSSYITGKNCGRNGKSLLFKQFIPLVRPGLLIKGKEFKSSPDKIAQNFSDYQLFVHFLAYIDDFHSKINNENIFNLTTEISVKNLYKDVVNIPEWCSPKVAMSFNNNKTFDLDDPSTYDRIYPMLACDYYHAEDPAGKFKAWSPRLKFGKNIVDEMTEYEHQQTIEIFADFLKFYLFLNKYHYDKAIVRPPIDVTKAMQDAYNNIQDKHFVEWAREFFANELHYGRPISRREMMLSFYQFKNERVEPSQVVPLFANEMKNKARCGAFMANLRDFAKSMPFSASFCYNPEALFCVRGYQVGSDGLVRRPTWRTQRDYTGKFLLNEPRVMDTEGCFYFFHNNAVPNSVDQLLAAPATDVEERIEQDE